MALLQELAVGREELPAVAEPAPALAREPLAGLPAWGPLAGQAPHMTPAVVLGLQRAAGNQAIGQMLARRPSTESAAPRRCPCGGAIPPGETECESCRAAGIHGAEPETAASPHPATPVAALERMIQRESSGARNAAAAAGSGGTREREDGPLAPAAGRTRERVIQRQDAPPAPPAPAAAPANAAPASAPAAPSAADREEMRNVKREVDEIIKEFGPHATTVIPVPDHLVGPGPDAPVASATPAPAQNVATWPAGASLLRSVVPETGGGKAGATHPEGGVVASVQACYDLMTGKFDLIAWVWAGAGIKTPFGWYGAYGFVEGELYLGNFGALMAPGACDTTCDPKKEEGRGSLHGGGGVGGFPIDIKPGNRAKFAKGGIEIGVLFTPSGCAADLELIGLVDIKKYFGPAGAAASAAEALAQKLGEKFGQRVECGAGFDLSVTAHLCRAADPHAGILGYTTDSIRLCGGGFVGCNINLSRNRGQLPGGGH